MADVAALRRCGLSAPEIFNIAITATGDVPLLALL